MSLLKNIKRRTLHASKKLGVFDALIRSEWRRRRLTILCYHSIALADEHLWDPSYSMDPATFESRLRMLREYDYNVVTLDEGFRRLHDGTLPPASVALTFDDGLHDFYAVAYPLLAQYEIPATVYLTTYYLDYNRPVFSVFCSYLLWRGRRQRLDLGALIPGASRVDLTTTTGRASARTAIDRYTRQERMSGEEKDVLAARLAELAEVDYDDLIRRRILHIMTADEARTLSARGVDFQLHTHRHRVPVDRTLFLREIDDNRTRIRELAGVIATHFCYPSGVHRPEFYPWLREAGVVSATTGHTAMATRDSPPLLLPRVVDGAQLSAIEFEGWLSGASAFLPRRSASNGVPPT